MWDVSELSVKTERRPLWTPACVRECVFSFVYMTERWKVMTWRNGPEGNTHTQRQTHMATRNSSHSHVTKITLRSWKQREALGVCACVCVRIWVCVCVCVCVCLMVLSTKPTKILPTIKKCSALAPQLIFPRFLQLQTSRAIVIISPSVSIWMPESQLRLRLIESAPGPSHAGTQMSSAWGGEEWRDGGRGAQGLNKSKSQTDCGRNNGWLQYWCKLNQLSQLIHSVQ